MLKLLVKLLTRELKITEAGLVLGGEIIMRFRVEKTYGIIFSFYDYYDLLDITLGRIHW